MEAGNKDIPLINLPSPPCAAVKQKIPGNKLDDAKEGVKQEVDVLKHDSPEIGVKKVNGRDEVKQDKSKDGVKKETQVAVYPSQDIRPRKTVSNKLNQEFRLMSEKVKFLTCFDLSFFKHFFRYLVYQILITLFPSLLL